MAEQQEKIKPLLPSELAKMYGISLVTFRNVWIKPFLNDIGKRAGNYYTIHQVTIIFEKLGRP